MKTLLQSLSHIAHVGAVLCAVVTVSACEDDGPIAVGFVGGLTGRGGDLGQEGRDGAILAVERVNASGGIDGRKIQLLIKDDKQDREVAARVDRELIDEGAVAIVGHMTSAMSVIGAPIVSKAEVLMISPTTSTNDLTGIDDFFLRVYAPNKSEAVDMARHARNKLGLDTVSIIYDVTNRAHTETWYKAFRAAFETLGGSVAGPVGYESGRGARFGVLAEKVTASGGGGVLILANAHDTALLCQHLRNGNFTGEILVNQWSVTTDIVQLGGPAVEGVHFFNTFDRDHHGEAFSAFKKAFVERFKYQADFAATFAFEATSMLLDTLREAKGSQDLKRHILAKKSYAGLQGGFIFDAYGDVVRPRILMTIKNGALIAQE